MLSKLCDIRNVGLSRWPLFDLLPLCDLGFWEQYEAFLSQADLRLLGDLTDSFRWGKRGAFARQHLLNHGSLGRILGVPPKILVVPGWRRRSWFLIPQPFLIRHFLQKSLKAVSNGLTRSMGRRPLSRRSFVLFNQVEKVFQAILTRLTPSRDWGRATRLNQALRALSHFFVGYLFYDTH
jgi:hypothetical protein